MQSRFLLGGMAVAAEPDGVRFALLAGFRGPMRPLGSITRPLNSRIADEALARLTARVHALD